MDLIDSSDVKFLEGQYCPTGVKSARGVCAYQLGEDNILPKCEHAYYMFSVEPKQARFKNDFQTAGASHILQIAYSFSTHEFSYFVPTSNKWKTFDPVPSDVIIGKCHHCGTNSGDLISYETTNEAWNGMQRGFAVADDFSMTKETDNGNCAVRFTGRFLTFWNCNEKPSVIYGRSGETKEEELLLSKEACPLPGRFGPWVVRRANSTDVVSNSDAELRGEAIGCFKEDLVSEAMNNGVPYESTLWLKEKLFDDSVETTHQAISTTAMPFTSTVKYEEDKVRNNQNQLKITASLTAKECPTPLGEADSLYKLGKIENDGPSLDHYTLDACECFNYKFKDLAPVTKEARALVPDAPPSHYNSFPALPILLLEGPYVCDAADTSIYEGEVNEDACMSKCMEDTNCNFFVYTPSLGHCNLLITCNRLGLSGLDVAHKLFGVKRSVDPHCVIANPEALGRTFQHFQMTDVFPESACQHHLPFFCKITRS